MLCSSEKSNKSKKLILINKNENGVRSLDLDVLDPGVIRFGFGSRFGSRVRVPDPGLCPGSRPKSEVLVWDPGLILGSGSGAGTRFEVQGRVWSTGSRIRALGPGPGSDPRSRYGSGFENRARVRGRG
uniref:Uncharacterized protein n=1 Tax=Cannabis sativa TaxID=3483 RepID=A0A803PBJ5_CANSA